MTEETLAGGKQPTLAPVDTKPKVHYPENIQERQPSYTGTQPDTVSLAGTDDEEVDSDYDWSGEEDLLDQEAKFEEKFGVKRKRKGWGFKRIITLLFSSLIGSTFLAGLIVAPGVLIHFFWYEKNPTDQRRYVKANVQAWLFWAAANLLISWYLALIVDLIPTVITFVLAAVWGHISEYQKSRLELYNSVKNTFKPLLYAASGWASWVIIFGHIFNLYNTDDPDSSRAHYTQRVYEAVEFLFFLALVICAQKMLSHAVAFAFHRTAFKERLDTVSEQLSTVEKLRNYKPKHNYHSRGNSSAALGTRARTSVFGTPVFSTPVFEKDHFNWGNAYTSSSSHANNNNNNNNHDDANDADVEDGDKTLVGSNKKGKRKSTPSWFLKGKGNGNHSAQPTISVEDAEHEMGVLNSKGGPTPSGSTPMLGNFDNPHRYPPTSTATPSPRHSVDGSDNGGVGETLGAAAKALKSAVLHDARNIKGGNEDDGIAALGVHGVGSSAEAKRLARSIYYRFKPPNIARNFLIPADFYPAFATNEEAHAAFRVFDRDNNGDISRSEIKTLVLRVYRERRFLAKSMRDVGNALKTLDHILLFFALVILFFISLSVFGVQVGDSLTSVYSLGIAMSFIFKSTASNAFDAIMFLFVTHPYDTGDRCFIDEENLVVKKMGLFATVFTRVDGTETYYFNSQLFAKFITNVRRSSKMYENCVLQVAWRTPLEKLDELERCLNRWLSTEENRWYEPNTSLTFQKIVYQRYLEVTFPVGHNGTWQDWGLRCQRKTAFHAAVQYYCRQLGIIGYEAPLPVVWGNTDTQTYDPPQSPGAYDDEGADVEDVANAEGQVAEDSQKRTTALWFTPPEGMQRNALLRARKSKGRKAVSGVNMGGD
ncbi:hypothetical protein K435DRAFT_816370 [Dendrothele bispora CBS 962.96]|uniref:EF-hand domain-containing protein n=1 Tax=Dendrothele bispora (strain CBS 962.96) TaxID=1314807 RepID=A0A4S8MQP7_DENBC|nr:hypothetical protein K435DRAFT_816370 [Dendrothele bispora CBS 962.96]